MPIRRWMPNQLSMQLMLNRNHRNPVHDMLTICGIENAATRTTFINIEKLDSVEAFASMNGNPDVTEMAKRMASRPNAAARRVILGTMQIMRL